MLPVAFVRVVVGFLRSEDHASEVAEVGCFGR